MMATINKIRYKGAKRKRGKNCSGLYIDDFDLLDHLEMSFSRHAKKTQVWTERNDCRLVLTEFVRSVNETGDFTLINTSLSYLIPEDVLLHSPFVISKTEDAVEWALSPPGNGTRFETHERLRFTFGKKQYKVAIQDLVDDEESGLILRGPG